ncbi:hypothetical protein IFR05_007801 [Cadophora sp. M221]|nr:hypothetical protein IFR05_007801 [Cadophora sp. M221]
MTVEGTNLESERPAQSTTATTNDDCDLPFIEQLLSFEVKDAAVERGGSLDDDNGSALGDNSGGILEDPVVLLGDGNSSASEAEVDDGGRAESEEQMRVFSIAQRMPPTRQLHTILMTSPRRHSACGLPKKELGRQILHMPPFRASRGSHCTTASGLWTSIHAAPDLRPQHPVPLVLKTRLHAAPQRHQRTNSVMRVVFVPVAA